MKNLHIVMTAAHGGYDSEQVPLGGGAAVCERLCDLWAGQLELTLLGSGPGSKNNHINYRAFPPASRKLPSSLNEWDYARFCRDFERATSEYILQLPHKPVVITHDISEGPNFRSLARAGIRCIPIFHVDVVDYFNRFYLGDLLPPSWWTSLHRSARGWFPIPDVLQLVFEKQFQAVAHCPYLVLPSPPMGEILSRCYPDIPAGRIQIIPWGAPLQQPDPREVERARARLAQEWKIPENAPILLTLSRISPEKNQELLLEALHCGEEQDQIPPGLTLVVAGEAAYMRGQKYRRKLEALAGRLRRTRVIFSGHLGGAAKRAALEMATLFVVPSCHESYGLTTMEAMAAGLPVVGLASYGLESTVDEDCGVLLPPSGCSPRTLWGELRGLLQRPQECARLARGAHLKAEGNSFSAAGQRLLELAARLGAPSRSSQLVSTSKT